MQSYTRVTDLQKIRTVKNNDRHNSEIRELIIELLFKDKYFNF
jgi:hypothetical protein